MQNAKSKWQNGTLKKLEVLKYCWKHISGWRDEKVFDDKDPGDTYLGHCILLYNCEAKTITKEFLSWVSIMFKISYDILYVKIYVKTTLNELFSFNR